MVDKLLSREIEPASFGIVDWYATLGAPSDEMEWCACALATQIPQRDVHGREGEADGRAHRVGVSVGRDRVNSFSPSENSARSSERLLVAWMTRILNISTGSKGGRPMRARYFGKQSRRPTISPSQ